MVLIPQWVYAFSPDLWSTRRFHPQICHSLIVLLAFTPFCVNCTDCYVWKKGDQQFLKDSNQPMWHQQPCHCNHISPHSDAWSLSDFMYYAAATSLPDWIILWMSRYTSVPNTMTSEGILCFICITFFPPVCQALFLCTPVSTLHCNLDVWKAFNKKLQSLCVIIIIIISHDYDFDYFSRSGVQLLYTRLDEMLY